MVLAETQEQADHAASLIRVELRGGRRADRASTTAKAEAPSPDSSWASRRRRQSATPRRRSPPRRIKVDAIYRRPRHNHNADRAARGDRRMAGRRADASTTRRRWSPHTAGRWRRVFGIDRGAGACHLALRRRRLRRQVPVAAPDPGGGGGEAGRRPVRIVLSREGVYRVVGGRTATEQRVALGAAARTAGSTALIHTGVAAMTAHNAMPEQFILPGAHRLCARTLQARRAGGATSTWWPTPSCARPASRSARSRSNARWTSSPSELGMDPIELRCRNRAGEGSRPRARRSRRGTSSRPGATGAERFGWSRRDPAPGARRDGEWLIGHGRARPRPIPTIACPAARRASR